MRLTTRHALAVAALALTGVTSAAPLAFASGDGGYGSVDCIQTPSAACDIAAGTRPNRPTLNGQQPIGTYDDSAATESEFGCRYVPVDYPAPSGPSPEPGGWFMVLSPWCVPVVGRPYRACQGQGVGTRKPHRALFRWGLVLRP